MRILITAATEMELRPVRLRLSNSRPTSSMRFDFALTGVGQVSTAYRLARLLQHGQYDWCWNIGIAGSFTPRLPVGSVAVVTEDLFADWVIDSPQGKQSLFEAGLLLPNEHPFTAGRLICPYLEQCTFPPTIQRAVAVTVNSTSGTIERIEDMQNNFAPDIESMEGAAFFYVALLEGIPFLQLRAISNKVEPRDKNKWDIPLAIGNLAASVAQLTVSISAE